ncbi:MAG: HAD family hydrolase [Lachnospiraceae bacterium]|nr:HAD family hydrolase [Lachnospiraceae bacterium]
MKKKTVFLDIDGTIYSSFGVIPDSTRKAIHAARENGHRLFLNTGRNKGEIPKDILGLGFDGLVGSSGAYVEAEDKIIFNRHLDRKLCHRLYDLLILHGITFIAETNTRIYGTDENIRRQIDIFKNYAKEHLHMNEDEIGEVSVFADLLTVTDDIYQVEGVNKVIFYDSPLSLLELRNELGSDLMVIDSTIGFMEGVSGEIYSRQINKATGMAEVMKHYKVDREDTIAFGDAGNDLEMLQYAGIGIAMGNGTQDAKQAADYITKDVKEDGLYHGFAKFGLI